MVRPPCCDKLNVKKGLWTQEEDAKILAYVSKHGTGNWTSVPKKAGLRRCGKSCRLRWTNYLRPDLKRESFTPQEEELIIRLHAAIGSRWSIIVQQLPGRTDNDVKNYWNTKLRKKLSQMGIDPVTHKPFSQILAEYGNIGGIPKSRTRIGSLNRDMKNAFETKTKSDLSYPSHGAAGLAEGLMMNTCAIGSPARMEPISIQDNLFQNNNINHQSADSSSLDLLSQLQAIKLVTEASNYNYTEHHIHNRSQFTNEYSLSSSSSSSCSTCSTAAQQQSTLAAFSWRDFLLEDPCLPDEHPQVETGEEDHVLEISSKEFASNKAPNMAPQNNQRRSMETNAIAEHMDNNGVLADYDFHASTSSDSSFVAAILDQEHEMFSEFANLLEDPCY